MGHWCPVCAGSGKLSQSFIEQEISKTGNLLLSDYEKNSAKLIVKCLKHNIEFKTSWKRFYRGHRCPKCSTRPRVNLNDVSDFVLLKNGKIIDSPNFKGSKSKIIIKCLVDGHEWKTTWNNLKKNYWCPMCSGIVKDRQNIETIIDNKNGKLLECPDRITGRSILKIQCLIDNYIWNVNCGNLLNGTWCPKCAKRVMKSHNEVKEFVDNKNGILLSPPEDLQSNLSKLKIQCSCGNEFSISYCNLLNNHHWCSNCSINSTQSKLTETLAEILLNEPYVSNFRGFDWLKDKRNLEIDIWFPELKLAVEYDGPQHFKPVCYDGDEQNAVERFEDRKKKDQLKNDLIAQHTTEIKHFIRFNFKEPITKEYITNKLKKFGLIGKE